MSRAIYLFHQQGSRPTPSLPRIAGVVVAHGLVCLSRVCIYHCSGEKGQRYSLPNGSIMLHQPRSLARGQASDIAIKVGACLACLSWYEGKERLAQLIIFSRTTGT